MRRDDPSGGNFERYEQARSAVPGSGILKLRIQAERIVRAIARVSWDKTP